MNFSKINLPRFSVASAILLAAASLFQVQADVEVNGAGWFQYGRIGHSSDPEIGKDLKGTSIYSSGAQLSAQTKLSEKVDGIAGIGVYFGQNVPDLSTNGGYAPSFLAPYVSQANFTAHFIKEEDDALFLRVGLFDYDYNPEVQNLGLYLLRGPLYPGVLLSGFEQRETLPVASLLGLQLHNRIGSFEHDFILNSETDFFPYFDLSPAYIAAYHFGSALRIGAGVNFYHLIPITDSISNGKWTTKSYYHDTTGGKNDSTLLGFQGTKLMVNAALDPKALFGGSEMLGAEDLKIYGEVGLFGTNNDALHKKLFGDMLHRMPMMIGFNIPAFKLLDRLAFETEWYGSPIADDLATFDHTASNIQTPIPATDANGNFVNHKRDNWKWSLYGSRVIQSHVKVSFQAANDHFRPGIYTGDGDNAPPKTRSLMTTPKDWYTMLKVAYFF